MEQFLQQHSGAVSILTLGALLFLTLLILVPQLLRAHQRIQEIRHTEHMKALEHNQPLPHIDERSVFAGRTAVLIPIVALCTAGTVTCFLVAYQSDSLLSVSLGVWCVAGVVGLAAITGGVALMTRLAQLHSGKGEEEYQDSASES